MEERLDRCFASEDWLHLFPNASLKVIHTTSCNHLPIFLTLNKVLYVPRTQLFRFENSWLKLEACAQIIYDSCNSCVGSDLESKLAVCGRNLSEWGCT